MKWLDGDALDVLKLSSLFAGASAALVTLGKLAAKKRWPTKAELVISTVEVASTAFFGGVAGLLVQLVWAEAPATLFAVAGAVLGSQGQRVTRVWLLDTFSLLFRTALDERKK